ncbi:MAG: hypothetical protein R2817_08650 [Flavobacteriales bacterium]
MSLRPVRERASELLSFGMSKQQVYDHLRVEFPGTKAGKVAELLRYMPSLEARERYGGVHRWLLITIALSAVLRIVHPLLDPGYDWASGAKYVSLVPIATLLVGWTIYRWQGQVLVWVGWGNLAGIGSLVKQVPAFVRGDADPCSLAFAALPVAIGVLALVLVYGAFSAYERRKDPQGGPDIFTFPDERVG